MITSLEYNVPLNLIQEACDAALNDTSKNTINQTNGSFFYDGWVIKPEYQGTVWEKILDTLPFPIGEARVIVLKPGQCYQGHADIDDRYHLNLSGSVSFLIDIDNKAMYETDQDGMWYLMDASPRHSAANFGQVPRLQLVVRKLLTRNTLLDPVSVKLNVVRLDPLDARFEFDQIISPWLNQASKKSLITDFNYSGTSVMLKIERHAVEALKQLAFPEFELEVL